MATTFVGISLSAPSSDPNIDTGQTFAMTAAITWSGGHGGNESIDLYFEYSTTSGGPYNSIPTTGGGLDSDTASPVLGVTTTPQSATITGQTADTYYIRVRGVGASTYSSAEQAVTVNAAATNYQLDILGGSASASGASLSQGLGRTLDITGATASVTGGSLSLGRGYNLDITAGTATTAGGSLGQTVARTLDITAGTASATGAVMTMTHGTGSTNYQLDILTGAASVTGGSLSMGASKTLDILPGTATIAGGSLALKVERNLALTGGVVAVSGAVVTMTHGTGSTAYQLDILGGSATAVGASMTMTWSGSPSVQVQKINGVAISNIVYLG